MLPFSLKLVDPLKYVILHCSRREGHMVPASELVLKVQIEDRKVYETEVHKGGVVIICVTAITTRLRLPHLESRSRQVRTDGIKTRHKRMQVQDVCTIERLTCNCWDQTGKGVFQKNSA